MKKIIWAFAKFLWLALLCTTLMPALFGQSALKSGATGKFVGVLEARFAYGPPNYGENPKTDRKAPYIALLLKSPVAVIEEDGTTSEATTVLQIIMPEERGDALAAKANSLFRSKAVAISGEVFSAITGHHHERILIVLKSIDKAPESRKTK